MELAILSLGTLIVWLEPIDGLSPRSDIVLLYESTYIAWIFIIQLIHNSHIFIAESVIIIVWFSRCCQEMESWRTGKCDEVLDFAFLTIIAVHYVNKLFHPKYNALCLLIETLAAADATIAVISSKITREAPCLIFLYVPIHLLPALIYYFTNLLILCHSSS